MDNLPLSVFYNYVAFLEQMIEAQEEARKEMEAQRNRR